MRVVQVSTWDIVCGIADYTRHLRSGLEANGVSCEITAIDRDEWRYLPRRELAERFSRLAQDLPQADVVHIQHEFGLFAGSYDYLVSVRRYASFLRAVLGRGTPVVTTFHTEPFHFVGGPGVTTGRALVGRAAWRAGVPPLLGLHPRAHAIAHSRTSRRALIDSGVRAGRISVIPHGLPAPEPAPDEAQRQRTRARLSIPADATVVGLGGFMVATKGHMTALHALRRTPEHFHLAVLGGPHPAGADRTLNDVLSFLDDYPELSRRVTVTGYLPLPDLRDGLGACDLVVAPYEPWPPQSASGALGWALASGRPVIASRTSAFAELARDSGALRLVTPSAPEELALALRDLAENADERAALTAAANAWCSAHDWERTGATHAALYAQLLGREAPAGAAAPDTGRMPAAPAPHTSLPARPLVAPEAGAPRDRGLRAAARPAATRLVNVDVLGRKIVFALDPARLGDPLVRRLVVEGYGNDFPNRVVRRLLPRGGTLLDIGAHVGTVSLPAAAAGCRVVAIEASAANARLLRLSKEANGFDNLTVVEAAAGAAAGRVAFEEDGLYGHVTDRGNGAVNGNSVPVVAIDELLGELGIEHVDVVKMDIEGYELEAFRGMAELLGADDAPSLVVESNAPMLAERESSPSDLKRALTRHGYRVHLIDRTPESRLVPVEVDELQTEATVDYVAWRRDPPALEPWYVSEPFSAGELVERLRAEATHEDEGVRRWTADAIRGAPPEVRGDPDVLATLEALEAELEVKPSRARARRPAPPRPHVVERRLAGVSLKLLIASEEAGNWYGHPDEPAADSNELLRCRELGIPRRGDVVYDVGAHHGVYSSWFAQRVGSGGAVIAFEPAREAFEVIGRNARLNGLDNVRPIHAVVGDRPGPVAFDDASLSVAAGAVAQATDVAELTLDDFDGPAPDMLKIDVEGYEGRVLRGAARLLEERTPHLLLELHPAFLAHRYGETVDEVLALVDWERYDARVLRPRNDWRPEPFRAGMGVEGEDPLQGAWIVAVARSAAGRR